MKCNRRSAILLKLIILDVIAFETLREQTPWCSVPLCVAQEAAGGPSWASFSTGLGSWSPELGSLAFAKHATDFNFLESM